MLRYSLDFRLERPHPELVLEPLGGLEVGLDCVQCGKLCRTVEVDGLGARCTPTGHVYPARLVTVDCHSEGGQLMLRAEFEYDYQAFVASAGKLAGEPSREEPGWARIAFRADCPACGHGQLCECQTNQSRPYTQECAHCGLVYLRALDEPLIRRL